MTNLRFARLPMAGLVTAALCGTAFAQDDCATATAVSGFGTFSYDNTGYTDSSVDPGAPCLPADGFTPGSCDDDLFFVWTADATSVGDVRFKTDVTSFDTVMQISQGACGALSCVAYDDDGGVATDSLIDLVGVTSGDTYVVQIGMFASQANTQGPGTLVVEPTPAPLANDTCATPDTTLLAAGVPGAYMWSNVGATTSGFEGGGLPCVSGVGQAPNDDIFFTFSPAVDDNYRFDTIGTATDTVLQIHDGADCAATCLAYDDDGGSPFPTFGESSIIIPALTTSDTLLIQVGLWAGNAQTAAGVLNVSIVLPPANDTCAAPDPVTVGSTVFDNTITTTSNYYGALAGAPPAGSGDEPGQDLFYVFNTTNAGEYYQIDTIGTGLDTVLNLYLGGDCSATYLQNSDNEGSTESRVFIVDSIAGQDYMIQVGGWQGATTAAGLLNVNQIGTPGPGNLCSAPIAISGVGTTPWDNTGMTTEGFGDGGGGACPTGFITAQAKQDLFFVWTANADGDYQFDTFGSGGDTVFSLHAGADCTATCVGYSDDSLPFGTGEGRAILAGVLTGDQVLVQVGTWGHVDLVTGVLNVSTVAAPTNDTCATPTAIAGEGMWQWDFLHPALTNSGFDGGDAVNCFSGTLDVPDPQAGADLDVFYAWTAECDGDYLFTTDPTIGAADTKLNVHLGTDCSATCVASNDDIIPGAGGNFLSAVTVAGVATGDQYLIQIGMWNDTLLTGEAQLTVSNLSGPCPETGITLSCDPGATHYLGGQATMAASSLGAATPSGLHLECTDGPAGEFGFFLVSTGSSLSLSIFNGVLCLDAPQGRYNPQVAVNQGFPQLNAVGQFDGAGVLQNLFGNAASTGGSGFDVPIELPFSPPGQTIAPGSTWHFQCWYRDQIGMPPVPGSSANFSNVAVVQF